MPPLYQLLYLVTMVAACGFTLWAGGPTERAGIAIVILASVASYPAAALAPYRWHAIMPATFAIDLATTIAFTVLMLRSRQFWPIWSAGFCLAMMSAHLVRIAQSLVPAWSYYHTTSLWGYPVMGAVVAGAAHRRWRRRTASS